MLPARSSFSPIKWCIAILLTLQYLVSANPLFASRNLSVRLLANNLLPTALLNRESTLWSPSYYIFLQSMFAHITHTLFYPLMLARSDRQVPDGSSRLEHWRYTYLKIPYLTRRKMRTISCTSFIYYKFLYLPCKIINSLFFFSRFLIKLKIVTSILSEFAYHRTFRSPMSISNNVFLFWV